MAKMKSRLFLKVVVVLAAVGVTWIVTGSLMQAQQIGQQKRQQGGFMAESNRGPGQQVHIVSADQIPTNLVRAGKMGPIDVAIEGRKVTITGEANIYDKVPGGNYIWLLRIYSTNPRKELLREHHYVEQATTLAAGSDSMTPTFQDVINLPSGSYKLELSNYVVPPGFPFDQLQFGEDMKPRVLSKVSGIRRVVITD